MIVIACDCKNDCRLGAHVTRRGARVILTFRPANQTAYELEMTPETADGLAAMLRQHGEALARDPE